MDQGQLSAPIQTRTRIRAVGKSVPPDGYTQEQILELFSVDRPILRSIFHNSGIDRRYLCLPSNGACVPGAETQGELLSKHRQVGIEIGSQAIRSCCERGGFALDEIALLCCVTTTGLLTPGLSAHLLKSMQLRRECSRLDVVGMGCNAGLNALSVVSAWAESHPGQLGILACIEVCSAAYVFDGSMRTAIVNSLFGDGAAAVAVSTGSGHEGQPELLSFASTTIPEAISAMRYDWDEDHGKFSFFLDRDVPYVVGANVEEVVDRLLIQHQLRTRDVSHWVIHSGGKKVIDSVRVNLGLSQHDVRHTSGVLRDYGNVSSASFLFSYERLSEEAIAQPGDYGVMITMGPGSTIETALIRW